MKGQEQIQKQSLKLERTVEELLYTCPTPHRQQYSIGQIGGANFDSGVQIFWHSENLTSSNRLLGRKCNKWLGIKKKRG